jgi:serine/threonine protein kinase
MPSLREEITKTFTRLALRRDVGANEENQRPHLCDARVGRQFGAYEIVRRLGAGGMGAVYLGVDKRLDRHVAVKFLAPELAADHMSLVRLVREARAASALNHPNILTIYDIGELDGEQFIVSEFVEGMTLRKAMENDGLTRAASLEIATQVAFALSAAHAAGVIHRDLKPTNIMLRPDGYVKVIDFGLAKRLLPRGDDTAVMQTELTRAGTVQGTAEYMSPEQARGAEVDHRTDIWSLGVILYEMLAGHLPFEGRSVNHVLVAIQDQAPTALASDKELPQHVEKVIGRCLAKDPNQRYSSAGEMLTDLQTTRDLTASWKGVRIPGSHSQLKRDYTWSIVIAVLIAITVAIAYLWLPRRKPHWFHLAPIRQLTFNGRTTLASISPDGKYLTYAVGQPDEQQAMYIKQLDSPTEEVKIPPREVSYRGLTFSPDNQTLYEVERDNSSIGRLYAVPLIGQRASVPILAHIDGPVSFSPEGDRFTYVDVQDGPQKLIVTRRDGQRSRVLLALRGVVMLLRPAWSPDGKRIAVMLFQERSQNAGEAILDLVDMQGKEHRRVMPGWERVGHLRWTPDGKSILTDASTHADPNTPQIHQVAVQTGVDRVLTNDLAQYRDISLSANGSSIIAIKTDSRAVVWISLANDLNHGETVPASAERDPSLEWVDGEHLLMDSRRSGSPNLALLDVQSRLYLPLTDEPHTEQSGVLVPRTHGRSVVFASDRSGEFHIWRFDADANRMQQLTFGRSYDERPSLSADGKWVVYTSWGQNGCHLMKAPVSGGTSIPLASYTARDPEISPDGRRIACYLRDPASGKWSVAIIPSDGSHAPPQLLPSAGTPFRWSPDGRSLIASRTNVNGVSNLWRIPLDGAPPVQLTGFEEQSIAAFALSPGNDRLACLRVTTGSDVALFKNVD